MISVMIWISCCPPCVAAFGSYYETAAVCFDIDSELKQRVGG